MSNSQQVWQIYQTARTFQTRPSEILGVDDPWAAYCLDNAVGEFGRALDAELKSVEGKTKKEMQNKSERLLRKWLGLPAQYRDPVKTGHVQLPNRDGEV